MFRWLVIAFAASASLAALMPPGVAAAASTPPSDPYVIVSTPDFLNADVGDVSTLPTWDGVHNSTNADYEAALSVVFDAYAAEQPDAVLVAGDTVEGHWGFDAEGTGIFGPVGTFADRLAALRAAGDFYYAEWLRRFSEHGLPMPYVAVGDHELGDNDWIPGRFKYRAVPTAKDTFARHFTDGRLFARPVGTPWERTTFATALGPEVYLLSVDIFARSSEGMRLDVVGSRYRAWVDDRLAWARTRYPWVIVQAHVPVLGPVRSVGSSNLHLDGRRDSFLWRTMVANDVDLYLCGEVHAVTATDPAHGPTQICHGGLFSYGGTNYLRIEVSQDRLGLTSLGFTTSYDAADRLWQTSMKRAVPSSLSYSGPVQLGSAVVGDGGQLRDRRGNLAPYTG